MEENEFKFEPIWVSFLSLLEGWIIYFICKSQLDPKSRIDLEGLAIFSTLPIFFGILILPMTFKLITGVPAIKLTQDALIDNVFGVSVDWSNIQNIKIAGSQKPFLAIDLKDRHKFYSGINNPLKRILLRVMFSISPSDVSINLAFVAGKNDAILAMTQVYWNKFYGNED